MGRRISSPDSDWQLWEKKRRGLFAVNAIIGTLFTLPDMSCMMASLRLRIEVNRYRPSITQHSTDIRTGDIAEYFKAIMGPPFLYRVETLLLPSQSRRPIHRPLPIDLHAISTHMPWLEESGNLLSQFVIDVESATVSTAVYHLCNLCERSSCHAYLVSFLIIPWISLRIIRSMHF